MVYEIFIQYHQAHSRRPDSCHCRIRNNGGSHPSHFVGIGILLVITKGKTQMKKKASKATVGLDITNGDLHDLHLAQFTAKQSKALSRKYWLDWVDSLDIKPNSEEELVEFAELMDSIVGESIQDFIPANWGRKELK